MRRTLITHKGGMMKKKQELLKLLAVAASIAGEIYNEWDNKESALLVTSKNDKVRNNAYRAGNVANAIENAITDLRLMR